MFGRTLRGIRFIQLQSIEMQIPDVYEARVIGSEELVVCFRHLHRSNQGILHLRLKYDDVMKRDTKRAY